MKWMQELQSSLGEDYNDAIDLLREIADAEFISAEDVQNCLATARREEPIDFNQVCFETPKLLSDMHPLDRESVEQNNPFRCYSTGDIVFRKGDPGSSLFIIKSGKVLMEVTEREKVFVIATLSDGDFFGEMAFLTSEPREATVRALSDLVALEISRKAFIQILADYPDTIKHLAEQFALRRNRLKAMIAARTKQ